jgi:cytochrome c553
LTIFFLKSLLSLPLLFVAAAAMYAMFEVFGRSTPPSSVKRLKRLHKGLGYLYATLFVVISYLCIGFVAASRSDPSPRTALHIALALSIIPLFLLKMLYVRFFHEFYSQAKVLGVIIGVCTFVLVGISAGFFLVTSHFGQDRSVDKSAYYELRGPFLIVKKIEHQRSIAIRTDRLSIERGRTLFASKCAGCHDPDSTRTIIGPGLKGILKRPTLPISGDPAKPQNFLLKLKNPMGRMPSFAYLSDEELEDLIAYLNTL